VEAGHDSAKVLDYLKQKGFDKDLDYLSDPYETMARGVAYHATREINKDYGETKTWPEEYDALFKNLAKGMATGKYPKAPSQGVVGDLVWKYWGKRFAVGDIVPGLGHGDTVPAWLTPGEFIVNKGTVGSFGPEFFHGLQDMARKQKTDSIAQVAATASQVQKFAAGGVVKASAQGSPPPASSILSPAHASQNAQQPDIKMTMVTVVDDSSLDQFLNTKKYGDVLVNKLGSRISRRMSGGRGV
jgi:hypothetical protein